MANKIKTYNIANALDVGTGNGLLSLMLAQKADFYVYAVEINEDAATQARENISNSEWTDRVEVLCQSLQDFVPVKKYDFIFSNPPFFEGDLQSSNRHKNDAKHNQSLTFEELIQFISVNLNDDGVAALLIPFHRLAYLKNLLNEYKFFVSKEMLVRQTPSHDYFRAMIIFSKKETTIENAEMCIHDIDRKYSKEFIDLLRDYYLNFPD